MLPSRLFGRHSLHCLVLQTSIWLWLEQSAAVPYDGPSFEIIDAKADIRDLDVGDLDDMEADVPHPFLEHLKDFRAKKQRASMPNLQDMMSDPMAFAGNSGGTQMAFATMAVDWAELHGKHGTDQLAKMWASMLSTGGVDAQVYAVDPGSILIVTSKPGQSGQVKNFVLDQPDLDFFELSQQRAYPNGRTAPLVTDENRRTRLAMLEGKLPEPSPATEQKTDKSRPKSKAGKDANSKK